MQFTLPEQSDWCNNMPIYARIITPQFFEDVWGRNLLSMEAISIHNK